MEKKIKVAKGISVKRGVEEKMRKKKGSSSAGKYKNVSPKEFAGEKGGASEFSFPINTIARARNALARAHFAPNPHGIRVAVYKKYPSLKISVDERYKDEERSKKTEKVFPKKNSKIEKVLHEFKEGELHSGSKKGPKVKSRKQAIAIALSESRKVKSSKKKK